MPNGHAQHTHALSHTTNGTAPMSLPYDSSRRRSLGASGSPPQPAPAPLDSLPHPSPYPPRHMPPPSPPQLPAAGSSLPGPAPLGPPTVSPFSGARDLASYSSNRSAGGMSIFSLLGGSNEEKRSRGSPLSSTPKSMPPPSPGRARSISMREGLTKAMGDGTPSRTIITEQPRPASAVFGHDRTISEPRREPLFASGRFRDESFDHFRAFQLPEHEVRAEPNGSELSRRPGSQPAAFSASRGDRESQRGDTLRDGRYGAFRPFGDPPAPPPPQSAPPRHEVDAHLNGQRPASTHAEPGRYNSPRAQQDYPPSGVLRFQAGTFGTPMREEQAGLFRPAYQPPPEATRETFESRPFPDIRREIPRSSPPISEFPPFDRNRNTFGEQLGTIEAPQRAEPIPREPQRKESDPYVHRAVFSISPEVPRKGSPLPQAVQGAQPRHIGPGGDNPGVKMEFGRMFSGLGSGVGTATPTHGNGTATPTRMTPMRQTEGGDLVRTAVAEIEGRRSGAKIDGRKKNGRRTRDEEDRLNGRETPDLEHGAKRAKTNHVPHHHHVHPHPHHHHHHHHQTGENPTANVFNPIRFQPSQPPQPSALANAPMHHHHHHPHPVHHHHHVPRPNFPPPPPPRKPTVTVTSKKLLEACAKKPRKHLGSQLYSLDFSLPPNASIHVDSRIMYSGKSLPIPLFEGKENCTYTVRVPRQYVQISSNPDSPSYLEEICKHRQLWGTEAYTDDSDVIAAAVHSGWLKGNFGEFDDDLREICDNDSEQEDTAAGKDEIPPGTLTSRPRRPVRVPADHDAHITVLLLPPLERYASTNQHHIWSREWSRPHDGMSYMIERIDFVDEAPASRASARGAKARKARIAAEEAARRQDAAAGLLMFSKSKAPAASASAS